MILKVKLDEGAFAPTTAHKADAGYDLRTPKAFTIQPECFATIDTGVHMAIPEGYVGLLKSKSGLNVKNHLTGEGVIDSGYTGSIVCKLYHHGHLNSPGKHFDRGDKIIQILLVPIIKPEIEIVDSLEDTDRGDNGFGSSGR